jgi:hypothetical protein
MVTGSIRRGKMMLIVVRVVVVAGVKGGRSVKITGVMVVYRRRRVVLTIPVVVGGSGIHRDRRDRTGRGSTDVRSGI